MGLVGLLAVAGGLAACGSTVPPPAATTGVTPLSQCVAGSGITQRVLTTHYLMVLDIVPPQQMYTRSQVASLTPAQKASGEVMISGTMVPYPGMSMSGMKGMGGMGSTTTTAKSMGAMKGMGSTAATAPTSYYRHLEVHVCSRSTGKVVTGGHPSITLVDDTAHGMTSVVPVAVMEGIEAGVADYHYGNNVIMPPGRNFTVNVVFGTDRASFHVSTPAG